MDLQTKIAILKRKKWCFFKMAVWMALFIVCFINGKYTLAIICIMNTQLVQLNDSTEDLKDAVKSFKEDLSFKIILNGYAITKDEDGKTEIEVTWDKTAKTNSIQIDHKF